MPAASRSLTSVGAQQCSRSVSQRARKATRGEAAGAASRPRHRRGARFDTGGRAGAAGRRRGADARRAAARAWRPRASRSRPPTNGTDGLQLARHGDFDAVVLDVMLPGLSGYEVVRRLRAEGNWVPVLMLSAKDGEHDQADALDDGADDYLTKPFSFVVLLARLRALLRRRSVARPAVLRRRRGSTLDPATRRGQRRRRAGRADPAGVRPAGVPDPQRRPGGRQDRAARPRLGQRRRGRHPTPSRSTSATCAARSAATGWSRSAAPATGWSA